MVKDLANLDPLAVLWQIDERSLLSIE